ncbi:MAG: cytochrome c oxidase assembly protein [Thermomicrobium sp.]|nr:cytochrome c oxidase assembly protein [Thermomicrobium sp.]
MAPLLPVLHTVVTPGSFLTDWHLDPTLTVVLVLAAAVYLSARRAAARNGRPLPSRWRVVAFLGGLEALAVALMGPPDHANAIRFSVHMVQHTVLVLVAAPLLALGQPVRTILRGLPGRTVRRLVQGGSLRWVASLVTHPVVVFAAVSVPFAVWHYPPLYTAAVRNPLLHDLEHATFFGGAFLFWWRLAEPIPRHRRLRPTAALLLVFAVWMAMDLVCATVTLAPRPLYDAYVEAARLWGFDPLADQRLGGAIMWIAGGGLSAAVLLGLLVRVVRPPSGDSTPPRWRRLERAAYGTAAASLAIVPLLFLGLGIVAPALARQESASVRWYREDPETYERRVAAFVASYRVGERAEGPVVAPPRGGRAYLVGRTDGWYPVLELEQGVEYQLYVSASDVAHTLVVDLGTERVAVRVAPGRVAVLALRPGRAGEYRLWCTELCGPSSRAMTGLLVVRE